ncbi:hypothetical protein MCG01_05240 [Enterococcus hirae]|nr:hypothetical protein [Enterococcus hirae]
MKKTLLKSLLLSTSLLTIGVTFIPSGIVLASENENASVNENVSGTMIFDKVGWPSRPPKSRNWKEKKTVIGIMVNYI